MKLERVARPSEVNTKMIVASGKIEVKVMMKLCQHVLDGKEITNE